MEWNVIRVLDHCSMEQGPSKDIDIASLITAIYYGIEGIMVVNRPFIRPRVLPSLEKKTPAGSYFIHGGQLLGLLDRRFGFGWSLFFFCQGSSARVLPIKGRDHDGSMGNGIFLPQISLIFMVKYPFSPSKTHMASWKVHHLNIDMLVFGGYS